MATTTDRLTVGSRVRTRFQFDATDGGEALFRNLTPAAEASATKPLRVVRKGVEGTVTRSHEGQVTVAPDDPLIHEIIWVATNEGEDAREVALGDLLVLSGPEPTNAPKRDLTPADAKTYVEGGAGLCPFCDDHSIEGSSFDFNGNEVSQDVSCSGCGAEWRDVYRLNRIEVYRSPEKPKKIGRIVTPEELAALADVSVESVKDFPFELGICEGTWEYEGKDLVCLRPMGHPLGHASKILLTDLNPYDWSSHLRTKEDGA